MDAEERQRIARFFRHEDAKRSLSGILLAKSKTLELIKSSSNAEAVYNLSVKDLRWIRTKKNKPSIALPAASAAAVDTDPCSFNVSHSGDFVVCSFLYNAKYICGVDVEHAQLPEQRGTLWTDFLASVQSYFTDKEWYVILGKQNMYLFVEGIQNLRYMKLKSQFRAEDVERSIVYAIVRRFFVHWTLKEAFIKAIGFGFGFDCLKAEFTMDDYLEYMRGEDELEDVELERLRPVFSIEGKPQPQWVFRVYRYHSANGQEYIVAIAVGPWLDKNVDDDYRKLVQYTCTRSFEACEEPPVLSDDTVPRLIQPREFITPLLL